MDALAQEVESVETEKAKSLNELQATINELNVSIVNLKLANESHLESSLRSMKESSDWEVKNLNAEIDSLRYELHSSKTAMADIVEKVR